MRKLTAFLIVVTLGIVQLVVLPGDHFIRSTSPVWSTLYACSLLLFLILGPTVAIFEGTVLRNIWKGTFLLYIGTVGTVGSAVFTDPGLTLFMLIFSLPTVVIRLLLSQRNAPSIPNSQL